MAHVSIERMHGLGMTQAVAIAHAWRRAGEADFALICEQAESADGLEIRFTRSGAKGVLQVDAQRFRLELELGFLLRAYAKKIEAALLAQLASVLDEAGIDQ